MGDRRQNAASILTSIAGLLNLLAKRPERTQPSELQAALEHARSIGRPCLRIVPDERGNSWVGGAPELPAGVAWPRRGHVPMSFLAELDLAEMRRAGGPNWLPAHGRLAFFYEVTFGAYGYGPDDGSSWAVLHIPQDAAAAPTVVPLDLAKPARFESYEIGFESRLSRPGRERLEPITRNLSRAAAAEIEASLDLEPQDGPDHHVGGFPSAIQGDIMELQCELVTNGDTAGDLDTLDSAAARRLESRAEDWRLLLQLDSDERMKANWLDGGMLYFWIREKDARALSFSDVWMVAQWY